MGKQTSHPSERGSVGCFPSVAVTAFFGGAKDREAEKEMSGSKKSLGDTHRYDLHLVDTEPVTYIAILVRSLFSFR